jgi:AcrR family transcriptional regulator
MGPHPHHGEAPGEVDADRDAGAESPLRRRSDVPPGAVDGRTARRDRNRTAVLDAVLDLFAEGDLSPSATAVAERSGVSLRSVYRYFEDNEELVRSAIVRRLEVAAPLFAIPELGVGTLEARIDRFVVARVQLYDSVAPSVRATRFAAQSNPIIREQYDSNVSQMGDQAELMFAPELADLDEGRRRAVLASVDALTQLPGIEHLREHLHMSPAQTADALRRALALLLAPAPHAGRGTGPVPQG